MNPDDTFFKAQKKGVIIKAIVDIGAPKIMTKYDNKLTLKDLKEQGFDSVFLPSGDGLNISANEYVIYEPQRVKKVEEYLEN